MLSKKTQYAFQGACASCRKLWKGTGEDFHYFHSAKNSFKVSWSIFLMILRKQICLKAKKVKAGAIF